MNIGNEKNIIRWMREKKNGMRGRPPMGWLGSGRVGGCVGLARVLITIQYPAYNIYIYNYLTASYKIIYSVATLSYDNWYANLRDYSNSLLCDLL
jgi:hypothetical protein